MFSNWKHIIPVSFQNTPALDVLITGKNNRQTWFCFKFSITFPHHAPPISVYFLQPRPLLLPLQPPKGKKRVHEAVASTFPPTSTSNSNMFGSNRVPLLLSPACVCWAHCMAWQGRKSEPTDFFEPFSLPASCRGLGFSLFFSPFTSAFQCVCAHTEQQQQQQYNYWVPMKIPAFLQLFIPVPTRWRNGVYINFIIPRNTTIQLWRFVALCHPLAPQLNWRGKGLCF